MTAVSPKLFDISADRPFLRVLANAVLSGFPMEGSGRHFELSRWTILLPTRRAVRELERIFFERTKSQGLLLPRIRPIGDIDEDLLSEQENHLPEGLPNAVSPSGQILLLMDLIDQWSQENPQTALAREIANAPRLAHELALSLAEFMDSLETEGLDTARIPELYQFESARHREAILELLSVARERYPARLHGNGLVSPVIRRTMAINREAQRLIERNPNHPFIAAGSTGSIPATRELLKAILHLQNGAVVLPGLDFLMDEPSWHAVGPTHPQYALKQFLGFLRLERSNVRSLETCGPSARVRLSSELMRPADTSHCWLDAISNRKMSILDAMRDVELVETRNVQEEATAIALILRQSLEIPGRTASFVTPDRHLARRVKTELQRWDISIDDSAGEPLLSWSGASLLHLLVESAMKGFERDSLSRLLRHGFCCLGREEIAARECASIVEFAVLRSSDMRVDVGGISEELRRQWPQGEPNPHRHPILQKVSRGAWDAATHFAEDLITVLIPILRPHRRKLLDHVEVLVQALELLAGNRIWTGDAGRSLWGVVSMLKQESIFLDECDLARASTIITHMLQTTALRPPAPHLPRLSILGLLEARLLSPDLIVLGGLNEGKWPGNPDSGPWLNRPMRELLGMQQPERTIGQTAHDFAQAFSAPSVKLVWSQRIDDAPAVPSRWVLRLKMLMKATGAKCHGGAKSPWQVLAARLCETPKVNPRSKPRPRPPVASRPDQLSVTRIEALIRDPYAIYARYVLDLEPLQPIADTPQAAMRGILVHETIASFLDQFPVEIPDKPLEEFVRLGRAQFDSLKGNESLASFWWAQFMRIAEWLVGEEQRNRKRIRHVYSELDGRLVIHIGTEEFALTCRADRIDLICDGSARVSDYKTGAVPSGKQVRSGLAPQLTLQAAVAIAGGFSAIGPIPVNEIAYIKLGGGDPAGEIAPIDLDPNVQAVAQGHLSGLLRLLLTYQSIGQAYLPRALVEKEDEVRDYDHLSRFREWSLSGQAD